MRTLLFINDLSGGGAQLGLAKAFSMGFLKNDDITVLSIIKGDGRAEAAFKALPNVRLINLFPQKELSLAHMVWALLIYPYWVFKLRPQVIFLSLPQANVVGRLWGHLFPIWHVTIEHSTQYRRKIFNRILPFLSFPIKMLLSDTTATLDVRKQAYPFRKNLQTYILPLYVAPEKTTKPTAKSNQKTFNIVSAGRLVPSKNFAEAIRSVALLKERGHAVHYTIYGDGAEHDLLKSMIHHKGLKDNVTLAGFAPDWEKHLTSADLYLQPSLNEGLCITVLEAMQSGTPVAASPVGGLLDYGVPGQTYEPLIPARADVIADVLESLIKNPEHRTQLATAAQQKVAETFSPATIQSSYAAIRHAVQSNTEHNA